jgi:hypothetical protein
MKHHIARVKGGKNYRVTLRPHIYPIKSFLDIGVGQRIILPHVRLLPFMGYVCVLTTAVARLIMRKIPKPATPSSMTGARRPLSKGSAMSSSCQLAQGFRTSVNTNMTK